MVQLWNGWDYASLKETSSSLFSDVILNLSHCYSVGGTALKVTESVRHLKKTVCLSSQTQFSTFITVIHCPPGFCLGASLLYNVHKTPIRSACQTSSQPTPVCWYTPVVSRAGWFTTSVVLRWPYVIDRTLKFKNTEKATNEWKYKTADILVTSSCSDKELPSSSPTGSSVLQFVKCQKPWCHSRLEILYSSLWNTWDSLFITLKHTHLNHYWKPIYSLKPPNNPQLLHL